MQADCIQNKKRFVSADTRNKFVRLLRPVGNDIVTVLTAVTALAIAGGHPRAPLVSLSTAAVAIFNVTAQRILNISDHNVASKYDIMHRRVKFFREIELPQLDEQNAVDRTRALIEQYIQLSTY